MNKPPNKKVDNKSGRKKLKTVNTVGKILSGPVDFLEATCHSLDVHRQHHFPGFLIAIEGIDGAGKTTQAHHVQSVLTERKLVVMRTKEPTTGHWGQVLRDSAVTGRLSLARIFHQARRFGGVPRKLGY